MVPQARAAPTPAEVVSEETSAASPFPPSLAQLSLRARCPAHPEDTARLLTSPFDAVALVEQLQALLWGIWGDIAGPILSRKMEASGIVTPEKVQAAGMNLAGLKKGQKPPEELRRMMTEWEASMDQEALKEVFDHCARLAIDLWELRLRKAGSPACFHEVLPCLPIVGLASYGRSRRNGDTEFDFPIAASQRISEELVNNAVIDYFVSYSKFLLDLQPTLSALSGVARINPFRLLELVALDRQDPNETFYLAISRWLQVGGLDEGLDDNSRTSQSKLDTERTIRDENKARVEQAKKLQESKEAEEVEAKRLGFVGRLEVVKARVIAIEGEMKVLSEEMKLLVVENEEVCMELYALAEVGDHAKVSEEGVDEEEEEEEQVIEVVEKAKVVPWRLPDSDYAQVLRSLIDDTYDRYCPVLAVTRTPPISPPRTPAPDSSRPHPIDTTTSTPRSGFETPPPSVTTVSDTVLHEFVQGSSKDHVSSFFNTAPRLTYSSTKGKGKELPCTCGPRRNGTPRKKRPLPSLNIRNSVAASALYKTIPTFQPFWSGPAPPIEATPTLTTPQKYLPYICPVDLHTPRANLVHHNASTPTPDPPAPAYEVMTEPNIELDDRLAQCFRNAYLLSLREVLAQQLVILLESKGPAVLLEVWDGRGFAVSDDKLVMADDAARARMRNAGRAMVEHANSPAFARRVAILAGRIAFSRIVKALSSKAHPPLEAKPYCLCYLATEIDTIIMPAVRDFAQSIVATPPFDYTQPSVAFQRNFCGSDARGKAERPVWTTAMAATFQHWLRTFKTKWRNVDSLEFLAVSNYDALVGLQGGAAAYSLARKQEEALKAFEPEPHRPLWSIEQLVMIESSGTEMVESIASGLADDASRGDMLELSTPYFLAAQKARDDEDWLCVIGLCDRAIMLLPGRPEAYTLRARARMGMVVDRPYQLRQAVLDCSFALALRPNDADIIFWRAQLYVRLQDWETALGDLRHCDSVLYTRHPETEDSSSGLVKVVTSHLARQQARSKRVVAVVPWSGTSGQLPPWRRPGACSPDDLPPDSTRPLFGLEPPLPWKCVPGTCFGGERNDKNAKVLGGLLERIYLAIFKCTVRSAGTKGVQSWDALVLDGIISGFQLAQKEGELASARQDPEEYFVRTHHLFKESFKSACAEIDSKATTISAAEAAFHDGAQQIMAVCAALIDSEDVCLCTLSTDDSIERIRAGLIHEEELQSTAALALGGWARASGGWEAFHRRLTTSLNLSDADGETLLAEAKIAYNTLAYYVGDILTTVDPMLGFPNIKAFIQSLGGIRIFSTAGGCKNHETDCIVRDFACWASVFVRGLSAESALLREDMGDHYFATGYEFDIAVDMYSIALTHSFTARVLFRRCLAMSATLYIEAVNARSESPPVDVPKVDAARRDAILRVNVRNLTMAIGLSPGQASLYTHRATALHGLGNLAAAYIDLQESFNLDPSQSPVQLLAIDILAELRRDPSQPLDTDHHICMVHNEDYEPIRSLGPSAAFGSDPPLRDAASPSLVDDTRPPTPTPPKLCYPDPRSACPPHRCMGTTPDVSNFDTLSALLLRLYTLAFTYSLVELRPVLLAGRQEATLLDFLRYAPWDSWNVGTPDGQMRIQRRAAKEVATSFGTTDESVRAAYGLEVFGQAAVMVMGLISTPEVKTPCFCYLSCHLDIISTAIRSLYQLAKKLPTTPPALPKRPISQLFDHCDLLDKRGALKYKSWERDLKIDFVAKTVEGCYKQLLNEMGTSGTKTLKERRALHDPIEEHFIQLAEFVGGHATFEHAYRIVEQIPELDYPTTEAFLGGLGTAKAVALVARPGGADWSRFSRDGVIMKLAQDVSGWAAFVTRTSDYEPDREKAMLAFAAGVRHTTVGKESMAIREYSAAAMWAVGQEDDLIAAIYLGLSASRNRIGTTLSWKESVADATLGLGHSDDAMLLVTRADALIALGRFPEARKDLELALKVDPDSVHATRWREFLATVPTTLVRSKSGPSRAEQQQQWVTVLSGTFPRESDKEMCAALAFLSANFMIPSSADSPSTSSVIVPFSYSSTTTPSSFVSSTRATGTITEIVDDVPSPPPMSNPALNQALVLASSRRSAPPLSPPRPLSLAPSPSPAPSPAPSSSAVLSLLDLSFICPPDRHKDSGLSLDLTLREPVNKVLESIFVKIHRLHWQSTQRVKMTVLRELLTQQYLLEVKTVEGKDWEKIVVESPAYRIKAKAHLKTRLVGHFTPSTIAGWGQEAWTNSLWMSMRLIVPFALVGGTYPAPYKDVCLCTLLLKDNFENLLRQDERIPEATTPSDTPPRLPPFDAPALHAWCRNSIKSGALTGGIWRSGPKWKSKVTSIGTVLSSLFDEILLELELAGELGRFDQVWPELARDLGGARTFEAMKRILLEMEGGRVKPFQGESHLGWLCYLGTGSDNVAGGEEGRKDLAEKRRILGVEEAQRGEWMNAVKEFGVSLLLNPYRVLTYKDLIDARKELPGDQQLHQIVADASVGCALTSGTEKMKFLNYRRRALDKLGLAQLARQDFDEYAALGATAPPARVQAQN